MLGHGGSSAGSYLADPTSPIPSHCAVITVSKCLSESTVVTSTVRVNILGSSAYIVNVERFIVFSVLSCKDYGHCGHNIIIVCHSVLRTNRPLLE